MIRSTQADIKADIQHYNAEIRFCELVLASHDANDFDKAMAAKQMVNAQKTIAKLTLKLAKLQNDRLKEQLQATHDFYMKHYGQTIFPTEQELVEQGGQPRLNAKGEVIAVVFNIAECEYSRIEYLLDSRHWSSRISRKAQQQHFSAQAFVKSIENKIEAAWLA